MSSVSVSVSAGSRLTGGAMRPVCQPALLAMPSRITKTTGSPIVSPLSSNASPQAMLAVRSHHWIPSSSSLTICSAAKAARARRSGCGVLRYRTARSRREEDRSAHGGCRCRHRGDRRGVPCPPTRLSRHPPARPRFHLLAPGSSVFTPPPDGLRLRPSSPVFFGFRGISGAIRPFLLPAAPALLLLSCASFAGASSSLDLLCGAPFCGFLRLQRALIPPNAR